MNEQAGFSLRGRNPDVLTCIANLSNDEVFTPPELANRMLDTLAEGWAAANGGASIWADSKVTFLDPFTKSGVFLREITKRLNEGLAAEIPDLQQRVNHILQKQVFGIGITRLTSLLARRSLYCSKHADGVHSVARGFDSDSGNIWFERTEHEWQGKKCRFCGAPREIFDREPGLENHAYAFIHTDNINARLGELFGADMQFDVIIGNPPYQLEDGGHGRSASPIYQLFVEQAFSLGPKHAVFVTPSRWMSGGKGLGGFRDRMLKDKHIRAIVDFPKLYEVFPGTKIRGGVSYFHWDNEYEGPCRYQTIWDGKPTGPATERFLDSYDVLVRWNEAISILEKVRSKGENTLDNRVSGSKPFGFRTFFHGKRSSVGMKYPIKFFGSQRVSWIERYTITTNQYLIDRWKVLMTAVQGTSAVVETKFLSRPIIAGPGTACSETYLVAGHFMDEVEAKHYAGYLRTRFVRFLISLRKTTQHATQSVYGFVPDLPMDQSWTDEKLYQHYALSAEEIEFIESRVAAHEDAWVDEV